VKTVSIRKYKSLKWSQ